MLHSTVSAQQQLMAVVAAEDSRRPLHDALQMRDPLPASLTERHSEQDQLPAVQGLCSGAGSAACSGVFPSEQSPALRAQAAVGAIAPALGELQSAYELELSTV
jgi:hypothetical protein